VQALRDRIGADAELIKHMAEAFMVNSKELLEQMRGALDPADYGSLRRAAQAYKESAAIFELSAAAGTAAMIQQAAQQRDAVTAAGLITQLETLTVEAAQIMRILVEEAA
jgi:HPt (histidine-containing phosphotransfer) domain-containing protein